MSAPRNPSLFGPYDLVAGHVDDARHVTEITLRDIFAAAVLAGICSDQYKLGDPGLFASEAFKYADAMLAERSK